MLTPSLAREIARETSEVIGLNVVITDADGIVLGSGDPGRIGTFHEASVDVARTGKAATHSAAQARRLTGVKPGMTLPIAVDGQVVGTVGITGTPAAVRPFGLVVRRQTEILLRESQALRSHLLREKAVADLLDDLARYDPASLEPEVLVEAAAELGYDLLLRRVAVLVDIAEPASPPRSAVAGVLRAEFPGPQDVLGGAGPARFLVLPRTDGELTGVLAACHRAATTLHEGHGVAARFGVGAPAAGVLAVHESIQDARGALRLGDGPVSDIADLRLPVLLTGLEHHARTRFVDQLLGRLRTEHDWPALRDTVLAWCENGSNLVRTARALHVHRNTVIYRLDRLTRLSGRDIRDHRYAIALYVACLAC